MERCRFWISRICSSSGRPANVSRDILYLWIFIRCASVNCRARPSTGIRSGTPTMVTAVLRFTILAKQTVEENASGTPVPNLKGETDKLRRAQFVKPVPGLFNYGPWEFLADLEPLSPCFPRPTHGGSMFCSSRPLPERGGRTSASRAACSVMLQISIHPRHMILMFPAVPIPNSWGRGQEQVAVSDTRGSGHQLRTLCPRRRAYPTRLPLSSLREPCPIPHIHNHRDTK